MLFISEIVGSSGVFAVKNVLPEIRREEELDLVIANADGATGGFGIGRSHAVYLHKLGVDVITTGECAYYKKDMVSHLAGARYMLRPCNFPWDNPGRGWMFFEKNGRKTAIVSILGQAGFGRVHLANPLQVIDSTVDRLGRETGTIIIDYHAATTAEKNTLFYHVRGRVSAIIGTHQRVMTSDGRVSEGTAFITEAGRTGSRDSVGGFDSETEIRQFLTQIPEQSKTAWESLELQGVIIDIDDNGKAQSLRTVRRPCKEKPDGRTGHSQSG